MFLLFECDIIEWEWNRKCQLYWLKQRDCSWRISSSCFLRGLAHWLVTSAMTGTVWFKDPSARVGAVRSVSEMQNRTFLLVTSTSLLTYHKHVWDQQGALVGNGLRGGGLCAGHTWPGDERPPLKAPPLTHVPARSQRGAKGSRTAGGFSDENLTKWKGFFSFLSGVCSTFVAGSAVLLDGLCLKSLRHFLSLALFTWVHEWDNAPHTFWNRKIDLCAQTLLLRNVHASIK